MKSKKGFTLIELLVTVAIIGLLSAVVLVSLNSARKASNDARRKADLKQLANAMEMYYDLYNIYPTSVSASDVCSSTSPTDCGDTWTATELKITTWMAAPPDDPMNNATYYYRNKYNVSTTTQFCVIANSLQNTAAAYYVAHNGAGTTTASASACPNSSL